MTSLPDVAMWRAADTASTLWTPPGDLPPYISCRFEKRHNDAGPFEVVVPWGVKASKVGTDTGITFQMDGQRVMTGFVTELQEQRDDQGRRTLSIRGLDALSYLGWTLAWPHPLLDLTQQTPFAPADPPPTVDVAETAVRHIVNTNVVTRRGLGLYIPPSTGLGSTVRIRPAFDNLLDLAVRKARRGGIGISVDLVNTAITGGAGGADLTYSAYLPADKSARVQFSEDSPGGLGSWSMTQTAPTGNRALVAGVSGSQYAYRVVTRTSGGWIALREMFVQGPQSFDPGELDQAADEALDAGAATVLIKVQPGVSENLKPFRDYTVGDVARAVLPNGTSAVDTITAVEIAADATSGATATVTFGDPDGSEPTAMLANSVRGNRHDVDTIKRRIN